MHFRRVTTLLPRGADPSLDLQVEREGELIVIDTMMNVCSYIRKS